MMRLSVVAILLCCASFSMKAQSIKEKTKKETVLVFSVNKKPVYADEFLYLYRKNHPNKATEFTPENVQEYLDLFINFKLKVEEAASRGLDTTKAFKKEYASYAEELRKPYLPDSKISDSLTRQAYSRMKEEIRASHILINVKPDAAPSDTLKAYAKINDLRNRILKGENFAALAVQFSEDPSAKVNKGHLGYFTALQMVYPFENAAYQTKVGDVSQPVRTRFGYHLIKVEDRRPASGEVEVSHIMIRTGEGVENEKARNTIFEIYDQLRGGVKWEELCKQYSDDPGSKDNGGRLRPFGVGAMASVPAFEQMAFSLQKPGDISDPFQSQYGWHIVRLEKKIPLAPFDEVATSLKARVNRDERTQISKQAMQTKLRNEFRVVENEPIKIKIFSQADTALQKGKWKIPSSSPVAKEWLFSITDTKVFVNEFFDYMLKNQRATTVTPDKYIEQLYNNFVESRITQAQEKRIREQHPEYKMLLKEYYEGIMLFDIMEKEVWGKASDDSVGQGKYYAANRLQYQAGERIKGTLYSSSVSSQMDELRAMIEENDSIKVSTFVADHKIREERGVHEKNDKPVLSKIMWSAGLHSAENNGMYYLARITEILPPGTQTFEEARSQVISDYQAYLEKQWLEALHKKYKVKIDEKGKQYVLGQLAK